MKTSTLLRASTFVLAAVLILLAIPLLFIACGGGSPTAPNTSAATASGNSANSSASRASSNSDHIDIEKFTNGSDTGEGPGPDLFVGEAVQWTYEVTNTGTAELTDIVVTDDQGVAVTCRKNTLQPGQSMTCRASGFAVEGSYLNIGTVVGTLPDESTATDSDPSHYTGTLPPRGEIDIEKSTNGEDADGGPGPTLFVGEAVQWTYEVTNRGDVLLNQIEVTDEKVGAVSCPKNTLQPGESMTCSASGTAVAGPYENIGEVVGTLPGGDTATDSDFSHYFGGEGDIDIEKSTNALDADTPPGPSVLVGDLVNWTYVVTNTGDVELTGIQVNDDQGVAVNCPTNSLDPGKSLTCTASGTAVVGQYANVGTVVGTLPDGSTVSDSDPSHYIGGEDDDDDSDGEKVAICHIPPGNPANRKVIEVGASAVDAHLAHGDNLYQEIEVCSDGLDNNCDGQVDEGC